MSVSLYCAHLVRFEFSIPANFIVSLYKILPAVILIKLITFYFFDLYRGMWRYTGIKDVINIIKASAISSFVIISLILFKTRFEGFSRSVFVIDMCFTILLITGYRVAIRLYYEQLSFNNSWVTTLRCLFNPFVRISSHEKRILIIGAGDCGEKICKEIINNYRLQQKVVGFIDDDPEKTGKKIHGIPVLATVEKINKFFSRVEADEVLIAIPSASSKQIRRIIKICNDNNITFKIIPAYSELIDGKVTINTIREVSYSDLLGREIIKLDNNKIGGYLKDKIVLVTGAGGSIGSELCRQICRFKPDTIILYERAESPLYEIELDIRHTFTDIKCIAHLADIRDTMQMEKTFAAYKPQVVFHAAAYKHVPMLEIQPWKAIENNIQGTLNLIEVSKKHQVKRFVFVSTDKAVRPTNVMGASKRVAEMLIQSKNGNGQFPTLFMTVRFGNVIGSVGSVVPLFKKQIKRGGPVTVTHPDVTRFFMTIPEACQLILQAAAMGNGGEIFLLDMGIPIKIDCMARDLIRLSGFVPDEDIKIEYVGLRPGEKLYEELITEGEGIIPTSHEKIMILKGTECNFNTINGNIAKLSRFSEEQDHENIKKILKSIVPEYIPSNYN
uniref:Capsular polysaccharide biosynthesis protein capD n=1 Tax=uncultured Desulfobacterium sp. TaxID=201089 RepID=E1YJA4_9BACT|nr:Capsular polysaccharide biosynthesis protein capD [uncultured Desulfobacterium sp.]